MPTQIFDLVQNKLQAPSFLRVIVVGGGFLDKNLFMQAQLLNWPLLPSYGMTECCSQIATAQPQFSWHSNYPELTILPHMHVSLSSEGKIQLSSDCLLTGYITQKNLGGEFIDPKIDGKITTSDLGKKLENGKLIIYGREDENVKIKGENVSLIRLQSILESVCPSSYQCAIIAVPEARQGKKIVAVFQNHHKKQITDVESIVSQFNDLVFPFEIISNIYFIESIPRTDLGKLKRNLILKTILEQK